MSLNLKWLVASLMIFVSSVTFAQTGEERPYDASVALGYVSTSGNTDVSTLNTEFLLTYRQETWTHRAEFTTLSSQQNGSGTAERYFIGNKSDYKLMDEDKYLYAQGSYTDDRYSGFDYQAIVSLGYGQYIINDDRFSLEGFAGVGFRQNDSQVTGTEGEGVFSLGEEFAWQISETSALVQGFSADIGDKRMITKFNVGLQSNIIDRIATKISFEYRNNSDVPVGIKKTDTQTSISLVYTF